MPMNFHFCKFPGDAMLLAWAAGFEKHLITALQTLLAAKVHVFVKNSENYLQKN